MSLQSLGTPVKYPSEIITLCITVEYLSYKTRTSPATAWLAPKKGAIFRLIYFLQSFGIDHIPNHYSFRKQCHIAIPQTNSTFYPQRFIGGNQAVVFLILRARLRRERTSWSVLTVHWLFCTVTKILLAVISRVAWQHRFYITKVGHWRSQSVAL